MHTGRAILSKERETQPEGSGNGGPSFPHHPPGAGPGRMLSVALVQKEMRTMAAPGNLGPSLVASRTKLCAISEDTQATPSSCSGPGWDSLGRGAHRPEDVGGQLQTRWQ